MKAVLIATIAALGLGAAALPSAAQEAGSLIQPVQYGGGYYRDDYLRPRVIPNRPVYRDYDEDDYQPRPRRRVYEERGGYGGYDPRPRRGAGLGQTCLTSRGACYVYPQPISSRCTCEIPGFGTKRGAVAQ